jgi:hypothetical protein
MRRQIIGINERSSSTLAPWYKTRFMTLESSPKSLFKWVLMLIKYEIIQPLFLIWKSLGKGNLRMHIIIVMYPTTNRMGRATTKSHFKN